MTFTYSSTSLATDLAKVRREIGDVNSADALLTDEEIQYALDTEGSVVLAAARAAEMIAATFARDFDWEADGTRVQKQARAAHYTTMAALLRRRALGGIAVVQTRHDDGWQRNRGVDAADVASTGSD